MLAVIMKLYNYFRSSASYRVRIALELKGLSYDYVPVHLVKGEHKKDAQDYFLASRALPRCAPWRSWWPARSTRSTTCAC